MRVLTQAGALLGFAPRFTAHDIGFASLEKHATTFTDAVFEAARDADGVILGPRFAQ